MLIPMCRQNGGDDDDDDDDDKVRGCMSVANRKGGYMDSNTVVTMLDIHSFIHSLIHYLPLAPPGDLVDVGARGSECLFCFSDAVNTR